MGPGFGIHGFLFPWKADNGDQSELRSSRTRKDKKKKLFTVNHSLAFSFARENEAMFKFIFDSAFLIN